MRDPSDRASLGRPTRVRQLDGLRGFAALLVVGFHYLYQGPFLVPEIGTSRTWAQDGRYGVELFFIISGFVILQTLERASVREFVASRVSRLYPTYWAAIVLTFVVTLIVPIPGLTVTWWQALINLSMLQAFFGVPHVDGVYWTLEVELTFYVQAALLWYLGLLRGGKRPVTLGAWLIIAVVGVWSRTWIPMPALANYALFTAFAFIPLFVSGIAVLHLFRRDGGRVTWVVLVASVVCMALMSRWGVDYPWWAFAMPLLTLLVLSWRPLGTTSRPLLFVGDISYALYLIHEFVGYAVVLTLERMGVHRPVGTVIALAIAVGLATALTHLVDRRARGPLRRLLAGPSADPVPTVSSGM